jgi:hypothetical protein
MQHKARCGRAALRSSGGLSGPLIAHTYWYLQATPDLISDIAAAAEALITEEAL